MAIALKLNDDCCMGNGGSFFLGDINACEHMVWYGNHSDGFNVNDMKAWLVSHNKSRTSVGISANIFNDIRQHPDGANAQSINARFSWCIGNAESGGLAWGLDGNNQYLRLLIVKFDDNGNATVVRYDAVPFQVGVGSGSNADFYYYFFDKWYNYGSLEYTENQTAICGNSGYVVEYAEFPVLQPVYTNVAENTLDNVITWSGNTINVVDPIPFRRTPNLYSGVNRLSRNDYLEFLINLAEYTPDPNEGGGSGATGGGGGTPRESKRIPDFDLPPNLLVQSGIIKMYSPSVTQMNSFVNWIYSSADNIINNFKKLWVEPMNSIVSLSMIPCNAPSIENETMKFCGVDSEIEAPKISNQFITINCGFVDVNEEYNTFLDYSSFTGVKLYLPFVGIVDLNTDDVMGARLYLKYNIDLFTGESIAYLRCVKNNTDYKNIYDAPLYAWDANVVYSVPITGNNWQQLYNGIAKLVTNGISGAVVGGGAGAVVGALSDVGNFATTSKVSYSRGGSLKANGGFLGGYTPYLIFNAPISSVPKMGGNSGKYRGFPSDIEDKLSNFHGYTEIERDTLHLTNFSNYATDEEIELIHEMLINGVVLP